jgi:YbgC/YbaW family acyl-CoA thioester hydrolase
MYSYETTVKLHHTDAANLLFFANEFVYAHDCYESYMESIGFGFREVLSQRDYVFPIVHAGADYSAPLSVGDRITIHMETERVGNTSFTFDYQIINAHGDVVGRVHTVHVCVDKNKRTAIPLPEELRIALGA